VKAKGVSRLLLFAFLVQFVVLAVARDGEAQRNRERWCGYDNAADWVCRSKGAVFQNDELLPKRARRKAAPGTKITTGPNSSARLTLQDQANCTIGGLSSTEIYTRIGNEDALFTQKTGSSSCTMPKTGQPLRILCGPGEPCPVELRAQGTVLIKVLAPARASTTQVSETIRRRARIVLCAGFLRVKVETESGFSESAGGASGRSRYVVLIDLTIVRTEEENGNVDVDESASVSVVGAPPGPGGCNGSEVREEQETVREERTVNSG